MGVPSLQNANRIVIKIGSALLVDPAGGLKIKWLASLVKDISILRARGVEVLIVSSGAIAFGRNLLNLSSNPLKLEESQAAAAAGQINLASAWSAALADYNLRAGQILLTLDDTEDRRRFLNARSTMETLLVHNAIPLINENDTIATNEIRYGDNDRLAARVASMVSADCLILLSDIDGFYTAPPATNPDAKHLPLIDRITPEIEAMAGSAGSELSRGGMKTKVEAAHIATRAGCHMVIASGKMISPISIIESGGKCTWFTAYGNPVNARKNWIAGQLSPDLIVKIDDGAAKALMGGKSLLPAGVCEVQGHFQRGDIVRICHIDGTDIGCGITAYNADDARKIAGHQSDEVENLLGYAGRREMIHRDNMVLNIE